MKFRFLPLIIFSLAFTGIFACKSSAPDQEGEKEEVADSVSEYGTDIKLAEPFATKSSSRSAKVLGWPAEKTPISSAGYSVVKFAGELQAPRWIYVAPNGDIFVAESEANRITLFRDTNGDGIAETKSSFLEGLNRPFGMLILGDYFYVANTDGVLKYPYKVGDVKGSVKGQKILSLPAGGYNNHWTRNILASPDSSSIYVTVGSGSNVGENGMENERRRANILVINPDGSNERVFAAGLRNPVGIDWEPETGKLWAAVNERDELGDQLVPDYITSVQENGFYGWPYAYWGKNPDPRMEGKREDLVAESITPDFALGSHTASLGLAFSRSDKFNTGAYVGQHGSWNRSQLVGYKVVFIPFEKGNAIGEYKDFLTGFVADEMKAEVYGRPVGIAFAKQGYMLVADDAGNTIWAVLAN